MLKSNFYINRILRIRMNFYLEFKITRKILTLNIKNNKTHKQISHKMLEKLSLRKVFLLFREEQFRNECVK